MEYCKFLISHFVSASFFLIFGMPTWLKHIYLKTNLILRVFIDDIVVVV